LVFSCSFLENIPGKGCGEIKSSMDQGFIPKRVGVGKWKDRQKNSNHEGTRRKPLTQSASQQKCLSLGTPTVWSAFRAMPEGYDCSTWPYRKRIAEQTLGVPRRDNHDQVVIG
jgi:hypothetical protein